MNNNLKKLTIANGTVLCIALLVALFSEIDLSTIIICYAVYIIINIVGLAIQKWGKTEK